MTEKDFTNKIIESTTDKPELNVRYLIDQFQDPKLKVGERKNKIVDTFRRIGDLSNYNPNLLKQTVDLINNFYIVDNLSSDTTIRIINSLIETSESVLNNEQFIRKGKIGDMISEALTILDDYRSKIKKDKNFEDKILDYHKVLLSVFSSRPNLFCINLGQRDKSGKLMNEGLIEGEINKREKINKKTRILRSLQFLG